MPIVIGISVFALAALYLVKRLPTPPPLENEEALRAQGLTHREARIEARAQRTEHRVHTRIVSESIRTASRVGKLVSKM